jgi:hypothetical protein
MESCKSREITMTLIQNDFIILVEMMDNNGGIKTRRVGPGTTLVIILPVTAAMFW